MMKTKGALLSKGILGPLAAIAAMIFDISTEDQTAFVDNAVIVTEAGGMLLGFFGRLVANSKIKGLF